MNIQELQTVRHHQLPGEDVRARQRRLPLDPQHAAELLRRDHRLGTGRRRLVPGLRRRRDAYGIPAVRLAEPAAIDETIAEVLASRGAGRVPRACSIPSRASSRASSRGAMPDGTIVSPALEDMFPFLDRAELARNMPSLAADEPWSVRELPVTGGAAGLPRWTAVLFDLDGTLVDTRPGMRAAVAAAFAGGTGTRLRVPTERPEPAARPT